MSNVPEDLKYTASHEWVRIEDGVATVGITEHAQAELGDVVYADLPNVGRVLQAEESFGSVESVKAVSDIYAPLAGEVVDANGALGAQPELLNSDPYGKGYLIKIKLSDPSAASGLLDAAGYQASLG
ncbi:MAG TPA: glycine cleavage system protein GcvH [Fimbriimonas sp.]|nr:glycine cleavage system protein GcvH [Fimbriimonas sp.]